MGTTESTSVADRVARIDWPQVERELDEVGWSRLPRMLAAGECGALRRGYDDDAAFRSTVDMARHRFGEGQYRYFAEPLPPLVAALRAALYPRLVPVARRWAVLLGTDGDYPSTMAEFRAVCRQAGQARPTPLLLRYGAGDYNCLHQDLYGAIAFPLQVVIALSAAGRDYEGGDFLLVEQRPRSQSRGTAIRIERGDGVVFTNRQRPAQGTRGVYRVQMRHGLSTVTRGERVALGIIFHDAK